MSGAPNEKTVRKTKDEIWPEAWAAYAACAWALAFAVVHLYWALGGAVGLPPGMSVGMNRALFVIDIVAVPLCVAGALLALSLVRPWGRHLPRRLFLASAWAVCALDLALSPHPRRGRAGGYRPTEWRPVLARTVEPLRLRALVLYGRGPLRRGGPGLRPKVAASGAVAAKVLAASRFRKGDDRVEVSIGVAGIVAAAAMLGTSISFGLVYSRADSLPPESAKVQDSA